MVVRPRCTGTRYTWYFVLYVRFFVPKTMYFMNKTQGIFFYAIALRSYIYTLFVYMYNVSYSWPNGWTKFAEFFFQGNP